MRYIPLLFKAPMVEAAKADLKTITRRVKGLEEINKFPDQWHYTKYGGMAIGPHTGWKHQFYDGTGRGYLDPGIICPYGEPGDILWGRETWAMFEHGDFAYRADGFERRHGAWERDTPNKFHDVERVNKWKPDYKFTKVLNLKI